MRTGIIVSALLAVFSATRAEAQGTVPPNYEELSQALMDASAETAANGGIFSPNRMWAAVVDRAGRVVAVAKTDGEDAWPGSRVIAMQKAYTANAFSNNGLALSTANLHAAVQPGGSLFGLQFSNPVDTDNAYAGPAENFGTAQDPAAANQLTVGGVNVFGGGLPLYNRETGEVLGAIGVSGDSSCTDHVIAWRMRHALGFTMIPGGVNSEAFGGAEPPAGGDDNIIFAGGNAFSHPLCGFGEAEVTGLPSMGNFPPDNGSAVRTWEMFER